jgi:gliding motility-associated lipoprotein GldD
MKLNLSLAVFIFIWMSACQNGDIPLPKPRAFPKVDFPERKYVEFDENYCEFTFERPAYTVVEQDTSFFNERPVDPCWFNLYYPDFDCRIHCSYYPVSTANSFAKLNNDAFNLAMEHNKKATFIDEVRFEKPNKVSGFIFNLEGPVATPFQFFMSDSTTHFLRGALYFNTQIRPDSLAPLYEFVKQDISHMINTFAWRQ